MHKPKEPSKGGYKDLLQDYQAQLHRTRTQKQAQSEASDDTVSLSLFDETQEKIKRNFARMKMELGESVDTLELKFVSQFRQLAEIREVVDSERKALEELYQVKIPPDSLSALSNLKKERIAGMEGELEKRKKDIEEEGRRRKIELDMREEALVEHQRNFEKHIQDREQKIEETLSKKRIELSKLEQSIEEQRRGFTQSYEQNHKQLQDEFNARQQTLEVEIHKKQLSLGKVESDLEQKNILLEKELELARQKAEEITVLRRIEWAKEEEAYEQRKLLLEKEFAQTKKKLEDEITIKEKQFWDSLAVEKLKWRQGETEWEKRFREQETAYLDQIRYVKTELSTQHEAAFAHLKKAFERELMAKNQEIDMLQRHLVPATKPEPVHKVVRPLKSSLSRKVSF